MPRLRAGRVILRFGDDGLILLAPSVEAAVARFVSDAEIRLEAGGIFVGSHRGPHVEITACTTPLPRDVRRPTLFDRRDPGHCAAALEAWTRSGGTDTFVGEWHTHPVDNPTPSGLDRRTWASIMGRVPDPVVFLIAGRRSVWCAHGQRGELRRAAVLDGA